MVDRYYNKVTKNEVIPGLHPIKQPDVTILDPSNPYWSPIPLGMRLTYIVDVPYTNTVPDGLELIPSMSPTASATEITLGMGFDVTGLPLDSVCNADGTDYPLPDGIIEATFATVGIYQFLVTHPRYYSEEWTVEVSAV